MDRKISSGLIQNGHFVYDFSYRDQAKAQRFLGFKKKSIEKMNQDLIDTCKNIQPDLLLLSKSEMIEADTLKSIKELFPNVKIAKWFVDFVEREDEVFFSQLKYIDAFFKTSPKDLLDLSEKYKKTIFTVMPNITDSIFERKTNNSKEYDVVYIARDHKEDVRYKFAVELNEFCKENNLVLKLFGSLGNPPIFGENYYNEISKARIAINFNRDDDLYVQDPIKVLGSSDRLNHFLGMGTCTFSARIKGFENFFRDKEDIVYFDNIEDCFEKIKYFLTEDRYKSIANNGQKRAFNLVNTRRVTKYMLDIIFDEKVELNEWCEYVFKEGKKYDA